MYHGSGCQSSLKLEACGSGPLHDCARLPPARGPYTTSEIEAGVLYFNNRGNRPNTVSSAH